MVFEEFKQPIADSLKDMNKSNISDTFSIQIDHNYINGVSPVLDIVNDEVNGDDMMMERKDSEPGELCFDDDLEVDHSTATTVIGQSEIIKLSLPNGVMTIPQTIIRLRNAQDFQKGEENVVASLKLSVFPTIQLPFREIYEDQKSSYLRQLFAEEHYQGRVQCALHMLCCLIKLISNVTEVQLPYELSLKLLGYEIADTNGNIYPLYLLIEAP